MYFWLMWYLRFNCLYLLFLLLCQSQLCCWYIWNSKVSLTFSWYWFHSRQRLKLEMVPHLPYEHSQTLHREGSLFIFTVNSLFHKDIAVLGGVYLRKLAPAWVSHQDDFLILYKNRGDSRRHDILWWYHVNKYRAMRGNRSELTPGRLSPVKVAPVSRKHPLRSILCLHCKSLWIIICFWETVHLPLP